MQNITNEILVIKDDQMLNEHHEIVKAVIKEELKYQELIVEGTKHAFEYPFSRSEVFKEFWTKLGKSVTKLVLRVRPPVNLEIYFNHLKTLCIKTTEILEFISLDFFSQNRQLEELCTTDKLINYVNDEMPLEINEHFFTILKHQTSLKTFEFSCKIPLINTIIKEIFAEINHRSFEIETTGFDLKPLPRWSDYENHYWTVNYLRMEILKSEIGCKVLLKPILIEENVKEEGQDVCDLFCSLDHKIFQSQAVKELKLEENPQRRCLKYYKHCFESFSSIQCITWFQFKDAMILEEMSKRLKHLTRCCFVYNGPVLNRMPPFPKLKALSIRLLISNYPSFERLVKSLAKECPALKEFHVKIDKEMTDDECVEIVNEHFKNLKEFSILETQEPLNVTLTLENNVQLTPDMVRAVIDEETKYKELEVKVRENALEGDISELFWIKLGKSVTILQVFVQPPVDLELYFNHLQTLTICHPEVLQHISLNLLTQNCGLKFLYINETFIRYESNETTVEVDELFIWILKHQKSLHMFEFNCKIPMIDAVLNDIFGELNYSVLGMDEIIFDCEPLPSWSDDDNYYWIVTEILLKFLTDEFGTRKLKIQPVKVEATLKNDQIVCDHICSINHQVYKSDSLLNLELNGYQRKCLKYLKNCCESFYHINTMKNFTFDDAVLLEVMSAKLPNLTRCKFNYNGPALSHMPPFPKLDELNMDLAVSDYKSFERFIKSLAIGCPSIKIFLIFITTGITNDECAEIIAENLGHLDRLCLFCEGSKLTLTGLDVIGNKMKFLDRIETFCNERSCDIQNLFDKLPKLEAINAVHSLAERNDRKFTRVNYALMKLLKLLGGSTEDSIQQSNDRHINDLPPELLETIFTNLTRNDQLTVRSVCQYWFEICSTSTKLFRSLNFTNAFLSWKTNPVPLLTNTQFKYKRISMSAFTNFYQDEDLSEFWEGIGTDIQEICFNGLQSKVMDAFKSGLKTKHLPKLKTIHFNTVSLLHLENYNDFKEEWMTLLSKVETLQIKYVTDEVTYTKLTMANVTKLIILDFTVESLKKFFNTTTFPKIDTLMIWSRTDDQYDAIFQTQLRFNQLRTLLLGKNEDWKYEDFDLILRTCPNINILGIVESTNIEYREDMIHSLLQIRSYRPLNNLIQHVNVEKIVRIFFEKLENLSGIYFVRAKDGRTEPCKSFLREGVKSFKESNESYPCFEIEIDFDCVRDLLGRDNSRNDIREYDGMDGAIKKLYRNITKKHFT